MLLIVENDGAGSDETPRPRRKADCNFKNIIAPEAAAEKFAQMGTRHSKSGASGSGKPFTLDADTPICLLRMAGWRDHHFDWQGKLHRCLLGKPWAKELQVKRGCVAGWRWLVVIALLGVGAPQLGAQPRPARLVIVMVWDGLRPDSVNPRVTPQLYRLRQEGVYFANHHSIFPTETMVNAAVMATATPPSQTGIRGDLADLAPYLPPAPKNAPLDANDLVLWHARRRPLDLEHSAVLMALASPKELGADLLGGPSIGQRLAQSGGMVALLGKAGPTFLFDPGFSPSAAQGDALLITDDLISPPAIGQKFHLISYPGARSMGMWQMPPFVTRDTFFTRVAAEQVLPAAAQALHAGHNVLLVLWQHNPDITQHLTGLGTAPSLAALSNCDANLGLLRRALGRLGLAAQTDLIVVSDHGFATIKARVPLQELLIARGFKTSSTSDDITVSSNGGSDELVLSREIPPAARRKLLQRVVDWALAQPWCGPIFSAPPHPGDSAGYRGGLAGTFSLTRFNLMGRRAPDLIISFREIEGAPDQTGSAHASATVITAAGPRTVANRSQRAIHPMPGLVYSDSADPRMTTGMGSHGAVGAYELHNFCAALGPDFRRSFTDADPTSNLDLGRSLIWLLGLKPLAREHPTGRLIEEALSAPTRLPAAKSLTLRLARRLPEGLATSTLTLQRLGHEDYLDGASVTWQALGGTPGSNRRGGMPVP